MNTDDRSRVSMLVLAASELDPTERERFLDRECGAETALRADVDSLLLHAESPAELLAHARIAEAFVAGEERIPERIGPYVVRERLGEGGMGVVYRAEQLEPVRRRVAIKLVRMAMDSAEVRARFAVECRTLALMNHPNIARILDAGIHEGRPYFVMEFVDGEAITDYCNRRKLNLKQRIELFHDVCRSVQHAHQKAVVHRDIKPTNILVQTLDGRPVPKLIDFGVAKAMQMQSPRETARTAIGQLLGTPEYMSPEQADLEGLEVDTRTDVYSLGVLLYELLVGALPFDREMLREGSMAEVCRRIREIEPPPPSRRLESLGASTDAAAARSESSATLTRALRGDLDWIVLKAMAKDPRRRYASPLDLMNDLGRHLRREAVLARPPSSWYRFSRFARRHVFGVLLVAAAGLMLVTFLTILAIQARRLAVQRDVATREADTSRQALDFLVDLFAFSDMAAQPLIEHGIERLDREYLDQPVLRIRLKARLAQSTHDRAAGWELLDELRSTLGDEHPDTLEFQHWLGASAVAGFQLEEGRELLEQLIEARTRLLGVEHADTLVAEVDLARALQLQGNEDEAERLLARALPLLERGAGANHRSTLRAANFLGSVYLHTGRFEEATSLLADAIPRMRRTLGRRGDTLMALYNHACASARMGQREVAIESLRESIDWGFDIVAWHAEGQQGASGVHADPFLSSLRGDPRFETMVGEDGYMEPLQTAVNLIVATEWAQAMPHLKAAVARGFSNVEALKSDLHFPYVQGWPEFEAIVAEVSEDQVAGSVLPSDDSP